MLLQRSILSLTPLFLVSVAFAEEAEIQDMSDPLAVYTQGGLTKA